MKKCLVLFYSIFLLAGCATIQQMNANMERTNELMGENTETMTVARQTIAANTVVVQESTATTKEFQHFMTLLMAGIFLILLIPSIIMYVLYYKLIKSIKHLIDKQHK